MSIKNEVIISFMIFAFLAVSITGYLTYSKANNILTDQVVDSLHSINTQKAERLGLWLKSASQHLELLARAVQQDDLFIEHKEITTSSVTNHLKAGMELDVFTEIFLLSVPDGELIASTDSTQTGKILANRQFYHEGQKYTYIESVFFSMTLLRPTMVISTPIHDKEDKSIAVLVGRLNLQDLSAIIKRQSSSWKSENSYLVNTQNFFITNPLSDDNFMLRKTIYTEGVTEAINGRAGTSWYDDYDDKRVLGDYLLLDEYKLIQLTEISAEELNIPIDKMRFNIFGIIFLSLVVALLLGWGVAVVTLRPLTRFVDKVNAIDAENFQYTSNEQVPYEISRLSSAFSEMVQRLRQTLVSRNKLYEEIEQRKKTEEQLQMTMIELKRSNEELEQFAYVASHDLQEPLRMVTSYNQLLADRLQEELDDKAKKYINYSIDGASRMQILIQDLLSYSRITTQGQEFVDVDCSVVLAETIKNLEVLIQENAALVTNDELPVVKGDPRQLVQLFQNLISNAIKFRQPDISPIVHIGVVKEKNEWVFSFQDNGIGIEPAHKDRIFVIFKRLHTREEYAGTGIGLALCKRITERHHGEIWFTSEPGQGTTFFVRLPELVKHV